MIKLLKRFGIAASDQEATRILLALCVIMIVAGVSILVVGTRPFAKEPQPVLPPVSQWPDDLKKKYGVHE